MQIEIVLNGKEFKLNVCCVEVLQQIIILLNEHNYVYEEGVSNVLKELRYYLGKD